MDWFVGICRRKNCFLCHSLWNSTRPNDVIFHNIHSTQKLNFLERDKKGFMSIHSTKIQINNKQFFMSLEIFSRKVIFIQHIRTYICSMIIFNARCALVIPKKKERRMKRIRKVNIGKLDFYWMKLRWIYISWIYTI